MITSAANPQVKWLRQLQAKPKQRREEGVFLAEGPRMVREAPEGTLVKAYCSESFAAAPENRELAERLEAEVLSDALFRSVSDTVTPQGILAVLRRRAYTLADLTAEGRPVMILEALQDPGNLGTILRTGEGAGIGGVVMNRETVDRYHPKVVRATMGSLFRVPCVETEDLAAAALELKQAGYRIFAAHLQGSREYTAEDYTQPCAFLIGNEGEGLREETAALADVRIRIPMEGQVESLNAAVASSLLMYEALRQRRALLRP